MGRIVLSVFLLSVSPLLAQTREIGKFSISNNLATAMALDPAVKFALIAFNDGGICVFPADQRVVALHSYAAHRKTITGAYFLNDGKHFVTVSNDGTLKGWDILSARAHHKMMEDKNGDAKPPTPQPLYTVNAHPGSLITASAISADAKLCATGSGEGIVRLWDPATGKSAGSLDLAHRGGVKGIAFHPEGKWLATGGADKTVKLWELGAKPKLLQTFAEHEGSVNAISVNKDGQLLAAGTGIVKKSGSIKVWNTVTGKAEYTLQGHADIVTAVLFHPKEGYLASGDSTGKIKAWDLAEQKNLFTDEHAEGIRGMIIARDASRFGTFSGPTARWWKAFGK